MSFKTISFKTDWDMFPDKGERMKILEMQIETRKMYERWANPDYYRKSMASYIADGFRKKPTEQERKS